MITCIQMPALDKATKLNLNHLSQEEINQNQGYKHEVLWYGVDALAHAYLMNLAKSIRDKRELDEFIDRYSLVFNGNIMCSLDSLKRDGIFIPKQAASIGLPERELGFLVLFNDDFGNRFLHLTNQNNQYAKQLMRKGQWKPDNLLEKDQVEQGIRFGKDLWRTTIREYTHTQITDPNPRINKFVKPLMKYYSDLIYSKHDLTQ